MKKILLFLALSALGRVAQAQRSYSPGPLKVSDNKRYIVQSDGTPFFWLGDTAWELFHRLNREEADTYLKRLCRTTSRLPITDTKPTMDAEPIYEDHPVCFNVKDLGTSNAHDVRQYAYLDLFAGAFGHTYGCHDIWQMVRVGRLRRPGSIHAREKRKMPGHSRTRNRSYLPRPTVAMVTTGS